MSENLSIASTRRVAEAEATSLRQVLGAVLGIEGIVAVLLLVVPGWLLADGAAAGSHDAARVFGALLAGYVLLQVPGQLNPVHGRLMVIIGIVARAFVGLVCLLVGGGFLLPGFVALAAAIALAVMLHSMAAAVLMSRP